jgi:hypothetical protein
MGAPKSGTTWLQTIMNAHPQVACFGEGHFVEQVVVPMQALLRRYNQKLDLVGARVYGGAPHYRPLSGDDASALIRQTLLGLMRRAAPAPQALWWGDKTPAYSDHLPVLDGLFPQCKFIDVTRDPRDVAVSALYHGGRAGAFAAVREANPSQREAIITHAVTRWRDHVRQIEQASTQLGARLLRVRYQDLIESPEREIPRLFAHLEGVRMSDAILADVLARSSFTEMSGGRQPGETDDSSFFRSGTTGQHENELTDDERSLVDSITAPDAATDSPPPG